MSLHCYPNTNLAKAVYTLRALVLVFSCAFIEILFSEAIVPILRTTSPFVSHKFLE